MRNALFAVLLLVGLAWPAHAQITPTYTFVVDTVINPDEVNANFLLLLNACNRTGCTMTGPMTAQGIVPDGNNTRALGSSGARWSTVFGVLGDFSGAVVGTTLNTGQGANELYDMDQNVLTSSTVSFAGVSDNVGSLAGVRGGAIGLTSQVQYDLMAASSGTQWVRIPNGTTGQVFTATTGGYPGWVSAPAVMTLVGQAEGTDTTAAATNVATVAISGLTVKDSLLVIVTHSSVTAGTAEPMLYNATDSVTLAQYMGSVNSITTGTYSKWVGVLGVDQSSDKQVVTWGYGLPPTTTGYVVNSVVNGHVATVTTAWTGSWTLALRTGAGGVTAGGTYRYRIAVYKIEGQ